LQKNLNLVTAKHNLSRWILIDRQAAAIANIVKLADKIDSFQGNSFWAISF
jgi:hypothetical protein